MSEFLRSYFAPQTVIDRAERWRSCIGAMLGIGITGALSLWFMGDTQHAMWLAAPMGASAVLLFSVPSSPLAQPRAILVGNISSAIVGVTCAYWIQPPLLASAVAVCMAIAAMFALRSLHPPSGGVALVAVLGGSSVHALGYHFVLQPIAVNTLLLLATALIYNKAVGRNYPHVAHRAVENKHHTNDTAPLSRLRFTPDDLNHALKQHGQVIDISIDELEEIFIQTEMQVIRRQFGAITCGQIMSKDIIHITTNSNLQSAWTQMHQHTIQALPVIDENHAVVGIITRSDFFELIYTKGDIDKEATALQPVATVMTHAVKTVSESTPLADLVTLFTEEGFHHIPVVDTQLKLVGIVTQTDAVAALFEAGLKRN